MKFKRIVLTEEFKTKQEVFNALETNWNSFFTNVEKIDKISTLHDNSIELNAIIKQLNNYYTQIQVGLNAKGLINKDSILEAEQNYLNTADNLINSNKNVSFSKDIKKRDADTKATFLDIKQAKKDLNTLENKQLNGLEGKVTLASIFEYIKQLHTKIVDLYKLNSNEKTQGKLKRGEESRKFRDELLNEAKKVNLKDIESLLYNFPQSSFKTNEEALGIEQTFQSTLITVVKLISEFNNRNSELNNWIISEKASKFIRDLTNYLRELNDLIDIIENKSKFSDLDDDNLGFDWDQKYADCKTKEDYKAFWDSYFSEVWGEYGQYVRHLNGFMRSLIDTKDWTSDSNQYIREIRRIINNESTKEIVKTKSFNNYFILIIDADKRGNRSRSLLRILDNYDIVLNSSFYKINLVDAKKYLDFQSDFINNAKSVDNKYYQEPIVYMWAYISLTTGSSKTYKNPPEDPTNIALSTFGRAKDKSNVIGFKSTTTYGKSEKIATDKTVQTIISKVKNNPEQAKELISYITIVYKSQFNNLFDKYENKTLLDKYKEQYSEISKSDAALFDEYLEIKKNIKYSETQMKVLLNGLLNITDPQEAKENK